MKDNLPEINIRGKKERRGGFLGWLRGLGSAGPGSGGIGSIGAAGSSSAGSAGLGALLAGNLSTVVTVIMAVGLVGGYVVNQFSATAPAGSAESLNSGEQQEEYVPAILRSEAANKGSSLAMFTDTNKGSGLSLEGTPKAKKAEEAADKAAKGAEDAGEPAEPAMPDAQGMVDGAMAGLQGGGASSLTTSLGSGSGKFAGMGNKFGGAMGQNLGLANNVGKGFAPMPSFQERKGKLLAMRSGARPAFSKGGKKATKYANKGGRAFSQAKFTQQMGASYTGTSADSLAATQNAAWVGETSEGEAEPGAMPAGSEIVTPLNTVGGNNNASNPGSYGNFEAPDACVSKCGPDDLNCHKGCMPDVSKWATDGKNCNRLILAAGIMAVIGAGMIKIGKTLAASAKVLIALGTALSWTPAGAGLISAGNAMDKAAKALKLIGKGMCGAAALMSIAAAALAVHIGFAHKQAGLGVIYGLGAVAAGAAAAAGLSGKIAAAIHVAPAWLAMGASAVGAIMAVVKK